MDYCEVSVGIIEAKELDASGLGIKGSGNNFFFPT